MPNPRVTAVIPVFNGERYLAAAVESVLSQSEVTECVVVDDGSTDGTEDVCRAFGNDIVLVRQPNGGVASARNAGVAVAGGSYVAFLDADDLWMPEKSAVQLEAMQRWPQSGWSYCGFRMVDERGRRRFDVLPSALAARLDGAMHMEGFGFGFSFAAMVTREALDAVGPFDTDLSTSADLDYVWRLSRRFGAVGVPAPLAIYRQHRSQMHLDTAALLHDYQRIVDVAFPVDDPIALRHRRRSLANLHTHVAASLVRAGSLGAGLASVRLAVHESPSRLVLLPVGALRRRAVLATRRRWPARPRHEPWYDPAVGSAQPVAPEV